ncbi:MAG: hypothetical protein ABIT38_18780 [Gemmatimonadaceae bacterium]
MTSRFALNANPMLCGKPQLPSLWSQRVVRRYGASDVGQRSVGATSWVGEEGRFRS